MDWAPDATPRYIAKYVAAGLAHSCMIRGFRGEGQNATVARASEALFETFNAFASALADDFAWLSASYIAQDSSVLLPATLPTDVTGLVGTAGFSKQDRITSLNLAAKSTLGSKSRLSLYGFNWTLDTNTGAAQEDFVLTALEDPNLSLAVNQLNTLNLPGIDGGILTWYPRGTIKTNDHWLRKVRSALV